MERVVDAWTTPGLALVVGLAGLVLGGLAAAAGPAAYGVLGLLVLLGLALVVPLLDPGRGAVAVLVGALAVVAVRLLSGGLGAADAWSALVTVFAALAVGWAAGGGSLDGSRRPVGTSPASGPAGSRG